MSSSTGTFGSEETDFLNELFVNCVQLVNL